MQTTQRPNRCPVYLHPAAASSLNAIQAIQRRTGLLVIISPKGRPALAKPAMGNTDFHEPWGGDAA
jgi:hypothetical protein